MKNDIVLKKLDFDLLTPRVRGWGVCEQIICYHVATFRDSNLFDMQHDHVLKKLNFYLLTPSTRGGGGWGFCRQNICYHVAAFRLR